MQIDFSKLNPSDYAAWWGAVIATLALVWNIVIAIRSGARLKVSVSPNMKISPPSPGQEAKTYIMVRAVNQGDAATTLTHFLGFSAHSILGLVSNKYRQHFIINGTPDSSRIPLKLMPGDEWMGMADQDLMFKGEKIKYLYLGIQHNQRKNPVYKRVVIAEKNA